MTVQPGVEHLGFLSRGPEQTKRFGVELGRALGPGDLILLKGPLGAGKTTLVQGVAAGAGATERVTSPSFTLINEYGGTPRIFHVDLFRLERVDREMVEALESYEDAGGVTIVEWAELLPAGLREGGLRIDLEVLEDDSRSLVLHTEGSRWDAGTVAAMIECALRAGSEGAK